MFFLKVTTTPSLTSVVSVIKYIFVFKKHVINNFFFQMLNIWCVFKVYTYEEHRRLLSLKQIKNNIYYRIYIDIIFYFLIYGKDKSFIFNTCIHKWVFSFLPLVVLSLLSVVVELNSVLCDDWIVLWTVVWVLLYVLSVIVVVVMSIVRNKQ